MLRFVFIPRINNRFTSITTNHALNEGNDYDDVWRKEKMRVKQRKFYNRKFLHEKQIFKITHFVEAHKAYHGKVAISFEEYLFHAQCSCEYLLSLTLFWIPSSKLSKPRASSRARFKWWREFELLLRKKKIKTWKWK